MLQNSYYTPSSIKRPPPPRATATRPIVTRNPLRYRTIPIVFGSITLFGLSAYLFYLGITLSRPSPTPIHSSAALQPDVSARYDDIAGSFDDKVEWTETLMGISKRRMELVGMARGDVLEVSVGTGRNLEGYKFSFSDKKGNGKGEVKSFTAIDKSGEMLEIAHEKFSRLLPGIVGVRWVIGDASVRSAIPAPPKSGDERSGNKEGEKYDTVVQTMGLCSVDDPVALLRCLGDVVKEEEGRILLLEHGRGRWAWLNGVLDKFAEAHAHEFGCWWNRDLKKIVEESGLAVVDAKSWHGGTTCWFELKKPRSEPAQEVAVEKPETKTKKGWW
ncbi:Methyltransferase, mitochondrial [Lachnellula hyalina]|uniref:Methyltransferase, mitochondrial n=1 Tax=Lachnellula hyalina TaxID=1316788 RepID=A0A8H8QYE2_9HELO|nr:Methyltransferase, mitochondrial [Lachnellula hyalina]TVY25028.1 Methyltransferase, mitochondrial [Lachnellula hyalina]